MSKIPVLYFSDYAALSRGGQRSLWYILRDLDRERYASVLVCQEEGQLTELARKAGIPVEIIRLPRLRLHALPSIIACLWRFRAVLNRYHIRLVHTEELVTIVLLSVFKPFRGLKLLWHVRVNWDYPFQKRVGLLLADRIVCVSHAVTATFPASSKVSTVQNGVDSAACVPGKSAIVSDKFNDNDIIVGYFASIAPHKGPDILLRAAARVIEKHPGVKFLMAGEGEPAYVAEMQKLADELRVSQNIIFWGPEREKVHELVKRADLFVMPTFAEGLSRSILEAMAFAKPVIASDIPENAELITPGETGLLFRVGDVQDFAEKINRLLTDTALAARLGKNARSHILRHFTLDTTMKNIYAAYGTLEQL